MKDNGPLARYRALLKSGVISPDPAQELAVEKLHLLHLRLAEYELEQGQGWVKRLFTRNKKEIVPEGLYLFGDVGRGKSMLMDLFFDTAYTKKNAEYIFTNL